MMHLRSIIIKRLSGILPLSPVTRKEKEDAEHLKRINKRIEDGLREWAAEKKYRDCDVKMEIVASELDVSKEQLSFYCSSVMKLNFRSWVKKQRIKDAKALLPAHPDMPISVIGRMVGIEDESNFRREFTQEVGCTPQEWRNRAVKMRIYNSDWA